MKVLIIDDHPLVRDALARIIASLVPGAALLEASDPQAAIQIIEAEHHVDLVLLDLALPGMDGLTTLQHLRDRHPATSVVVVSAFADRQRVSQVLDCGASGFIPKSSSNEVLKNALRLVIGGGIYIPPEVLGRGETPAPLAPSAQDYRAALRKIGLTARQAQILDLILKGRSNKMIARDLQLAETTVKNQVTAILKALNVTSRTQAVLAVAARGILLPGPRGQGS